MPPANLHVIGIDPGENTGWCRLTIPRTSIYGKEPGEIVEWDYGEFTGPEPHQVRDICRLVRETQSLDFGVGPALVVEDFDIPPEAPTTDPVLLIPVRIAAMLRYAQFMGQLGPDALVMLQGRTDAKGTATDERLKLWGLYTAGSDHVRDATRHAIVAVRRAKAKVEVRNAMWADPARPRVAVARGASLLGLARERQ